jgi:hypothetical protein
MHNDEPTDDQLNNDDPLDDDDPQAGGNAREGYLLLRIVKRRCEDGEPPYEIRARIQDGGFFKWRTLQGRFFYFDDAMLRAYELAADNGCDVEHQ